MLCWNVKRLDVHIYIYLCMHICYTLHMWTHYSSPPSSWLPLPQATKAFLPQGFYCVVAFQCTITCNLIRTFMCASVHVAQPLEYHHTCVKCNVYLFSYHLLHNSSFLEPTHFARFHTLTTCVYHCKIQCMMMLCQNNYHEFCPSQSSKITKIF